MVGDLFVVEDEAGFPDVGGPAGTVAAAGEVVEGCLGGHSGEGSFKST